MSQLDLFVWSETKPSNVIDAMPSLIHKAAQEVIYNIPNRRGDGRVINLSARRAA